MEIKRKVSLVVIFVFKGIIETIMVCDTTTNNSNPPT